MSQTGLLQVQLCHPGAAVWTEPVAEQIETLQNERGRGRRINTLQMGFDDSGAAPAVLLV